jgi:hypothetical protein
MTLDNPVSNVAEFKVFPNPVKNILQVSFPDNITHVTFTVYDVLGKQIIETLLYQDYKAINLEQLPPGIYISKLQADNQKSTTYKLIKE